MSGRKEEVVEKIPEPFEYFEFIPKPFEQKELIGAIRSAMAKARLPRKQAPVNTAVSSPLPIAEAGSSAEIQILKEKITNMQAEIDGLKQQIGQIMLLIKQNAS